MLKLLSTGKEVVRYLNKYRDLKITSQLKSGDEMLSFTLLERNANDIYNECYVETETARYVIKETGRTTDDYPAFTAQLELEDLEAGIFEQFTAEGKTAAQAAALAIAGTGWTVSSTMAKQRSAQAYRLTPLQALGKIRDAFMCELWFDNLRKVVHLEERRGEDKGVYFIAGLNLRKLTATEDSYDYYTRLIPIGKDDLRINDVNGGIGYVENFQYTNKVHTLIWSDTSYTDANALKEDAIAKLADLSKPKKSYSAQIIDLARQKPGYGILSYSLGDTVTLADRSTGVKERQRIVKTVVYPDDPEKNTCELANTTLTFEEQQDRLNKAAQAWETVSNTDGTVNGVWVHGIQSGDIVDIETTISENSTVQSAASDASSALTRVGTVETDLQAVTARVGTIETTYLTAAQAQITYATIANLNATNATVHDLSVDYGGFKTVATNELAAHEAVIDSLDATYASIRALDAVDARIDNLGATYATIDLANVQAGSIKTAMIDTGAVQTAQIADGSITDAKIVGLTASKITAGTLNAGVIDVVNLNADNITTGSINGQRIENGAISQDKLTQALSDTIDSAVANTQVLYALGASPSTAPTTGWSETAPEWEADKYMWQKTVITYVDGSVLEKAPTCISGADGMPGYTVYIDSSAGLQFKNKDGTTTLTAKVYQGANEIDPAGTELKYAWAKYDKDGELIPYFNPRGKSIVQTADDVDSKATYRLTVSWLAEVLLTTRSGRQLTTRGGLDMAIYAEG